MRQLGGQVGEGVPAYARGRLDADDVQRLERVQDLETLLGDAAVPDVEAFEPAQRREIFESFIRQVGPAPQMQTLEVRQAGQMGEPLVADAWTEKKQLLQVGQAGKRRQIVVAEGILIDNQGIPQASRFAPRECAG